MPAVLGIDAAWTTTQPSGIALVTWRDGDWRLTAVASAYADFYQSAGLSDFEADFNATHLLAGAQRLSGQPVTLIAADIPLARHPITSRRASDNGISRLYGSRHASTHTPSVTRPGPLADRIATDFAAAGYGLQTAAPATGGLIEVYPHPALIELARAPRRLPYKIGKTTKYWPDLSPPERRINLLAQWRQIIALLDSCIHGVAAAFPEPPATSSGRTLKSYEDALDAVVCAWVGICALEGRAIPVGDADSAIWIPQPLIP